MVKMMRAIDVDKLEWFQITCEASQQKAILILRPHIHDLDIIDAEPVRHGHWEEIKNAHGELEGYICKCGREVKAKENFCPSCGLKMDLEDQHD